MRKNVKSDWYTKHREKKLKLRKAKNKKVAK